MGMMKREAEDIAPTYNDKKTSSEILDFGQQHREDLTYQQPWKWDIPSFR